jgi:NADH dehydrogenase FAD-containing subunit
LFFCGDVAAVPAASTASAAAADAAFELKLAQCAEEHASIVAHNILATILSPSNPQLREQTVPKDRMMVLSLGRYDGVFVFGNFILAGAFPAMTKAVVLWKTLINYWSWDSIWRHVACTLQGRRAGRTLTTPVTSPLPREPNHIHYV